MVTLGRSINWLKTHLWSLIEYRQPSNRWLGALLWTCAGQLLLFFGLALAIASFAYAAKLVWHPLLMVLAMLLSLLATKGAISSAYPEFGAGWLRLLALSTTINVAAVVTAGALCDHTMDYSWDGQWYHHEALLALHSGWNPVFDEHVNPFSKHYPYGAWALRHAFVVLFSSMEAGKVVNCLVMAASFAFSYHAATHALGLNWRKGLVIGGLLALSPTAVGQALTFYVDGFLCSLLVAMFGATVCAWKFKASIYPILVGLTGVLAINTKFTGLVYTVLLLAPVGLALLKFNLRRGLVMLSTLAVSVILGVCIVGYHPYVTNTITKSDPFFPADKDLVRDAAHEQFLKMSQAKRFALSLFALGQPAPGERPMVKIPLTTTWNEVEQAGRYDIRFGGYGPFFSGALLLGFALVICRIRYAPVHVMGVLGSSFVVVASAAVMPAGWWSRLAPHVHAVPVLCLVGVWMLRAKGGWVLATVLAANVTCVLYSAAALTIASNTQFAQDINVLRDKARTHEIMLRSQFDSTRYRLADLGINYTEVERLPCPLPYAIKGLWAQACFEPKAPQASTAITSANR